MYCRTSGNYLRVLSNGTKISEYIMAPWGKGGGGGVTPYSWRAGVLVVFFGVSNWQSVLKYLVCFKGNPGTDLELNVLDVCR